MITLTDPAEYRDEMGNVISCAGNTGAGVTVFLSGRNNKLLVHEGARLGKLRIRFDCDNGYCEIKKSKFRGLIRVGEDCKVTIGRGVTCTGPCYVSTAEHCSVSIGDDCMIASRNEIRADDAHPIFSVLTGKRVNMPKSIVIENHVWLGANAVVLGGSRIGEGSIIGLGSIVKGVVPNNCVAAGIPARVVRRDCAWERPHLTLREPHYKPDVTVIKKSRYWNLTAKDED